MHCNRNLVLLGPVDSGKSALTELIVEGGGRRNDRSRQVDINLAPDEPGIRARLFEPTAVDRNRVSLDIVREQTTDTCFVVVVDITKSAEFANELDSLKELSEFLSDLSYSLFGNCMIAFTHIDELPAEVNTDRLVQQEFQEILSLVENRCMFLNTTDRNQESKGRALEQIIRLSKPTLRVLCYGNTEFPSSWISDIFDMPEFSTRIRATGLQLSFHPNLTVAAIHRTFELESDLLLKIGQADEIGTGISVIVILITLTGPYHTGYGMLMDLLPGRHGIDPNYEKYFWSRVVIIFHLNEGNYTSIIKHSIDNSVGIRILLIRAGWRYTYMGKYRPNSEFILQFISLCKRVRDENNNREFIGGKNINERAIRDITMRRDEMALSNQIFTFVRRHPRKLLLAMLIASTPVIYRFVYSTVKYISKLFS